MHYECLKPDLIFAEAIDYLDKVTSRHIDYAKELLSLHKTETPPTMYNEMALAFFESIVAKLEKAKNDYIENEKYELGINYNVVEPLEFGEHECPKDCTPLILSKEQLYDLCVHIIDCLKTDIYSFRDEQIKAFEAITNDKSSDIDTSYFYSSLIQLYKRLCDIEIMVLNDAYADLAM